MQNSFEKDPLKALSRSIIAAMLILFLVSMIGTTIGGSSRGKGYNKDTLTDEVNAGILINEAATMRAAPTSTVPSGIQKCESGDPGMAKDEEKRRAFEEMAEVSLIRAECGMSVGDGVGTAKPAKRPQNPTPYQKSVWQMADVAAQSAREKHKSKSDQQKKDECKGGKRHFYHTAALCSLDDDGQIQKNQCPGCDAGVNPPKNWKAAKQEEYGPFWDPNTECWRWVIILYGVP